MISRTTLLVRAVLAILAVGVTGASVEALLDAAVDELAPALRASAGKPRLHRHAARGSRYAAHVLAHAIDAAHGGGVFHGRLVGGDGSIGIVGARAAVSSPRRVGDEVARIAAIGRVRKAHRTARSQPDALKDEEGRLGAGIVGGGNAPVPCAFRCTLQIGLEVSSDATLLEHASDAAVAARHGATGRHLVAASLWTVRRQTFLASRAGNPRDARIRNGDGLGVEAHCR